MPPPRIAIIGAGMTGVTCAAHLAEAGHQATVFDKGRGLGGRLATRRVGDRFTFDHGAQYVTARTPEFQALLDGHRRNGAAQHWTPRLAIDVATGSAPWVVGTPGMNGLVKPQAENLDIHLSTEISQIARVNSHWNIAFSGTATVQSFDFVVVTAPPEQTTRLLAAEAWIAQALTPVQIAPCWALLVAFDTRIDPGFDVWRGTDGPISWAARNTTKPGRTGAADCWVVHASPDWSTANLEGTKDQAAEALMSAIPAVLGQNLPPTIHMSAHRWRYAMTRTALGQPFLSSEDRTLMIGGDWALGARVEYAYESGAAIAKALVETLSTA